MFRTYDDLIRVAEKRAVDDEPRVFTRTSEIAPALSQDHDFFMREFECLVSHVEEQPLIQSCLTCEKKVK